MSLPTPMGAGKSKARETYVLLHVRKPKRKLFKLLVVSPGIRHRSWLFIELMAKFETKIRMGTIHSPLKVDSYL